MSGVSPLTTTATGGPPALVVAVFLTLFVATGLSLYLAVRLYRGYRTASDPARFRLLVGLLLLTTVPLLVRLVLSNVDGVGATTRELLATASQLCGLLVVLGVVYDV